MDLRLDRRECFNRAKEALSRGTEADLRYACLELRLCIEGLAYATLQRYSDRVPPDLLETWQPRIMMRMLREYEPRAHAERTTRIYAQNADGSKGPLVLEGRHTPLTLATVNRFYDRLGSYLHVPTLAKQRKPADLRQWYEKLRSSVEEVVSELAPVVSNTFGGHMSDVFTFQCFGCDLRTIVNAEATTAKKTATCNNCGADHVVVIHDDGTPEFFLDVVVSECDRCGNPIQIEKRMAVGAIFTCESCRTSFVFTGLEFIYDYAPGEKTPNATRVQIDAGV